MITEKDLHNGAIVDIVHLRKAFGDHVVLDDINLSVKPGEKVVVLGPSGSGKSTMLRCINALEVATSGQIFVNGNEITHPRCNLNKIREHLGMVFQRFNLWPHKTVIENLMLAQQIVLKRGPEEARKQGLALLKRVGLLLYDRERQDVHAGASGCGCSASVLCGHLLRRMERGELRRILFCATGALMSPTSSQQGLAIPGVCHVLELVSQQ